MDSNCQSDLHNSDLSYLKQNDEATKSPIENRNLKHFKKSMIVEYESGINDDSHSSSSSSNSTTSTNSNHLETKQELKKKSNSKHCLKDVEQRKKAKLDDLYENERSNDDDDYEDDLNPYQNRSNQSDSSNTDSTDSKSENESHDEARTSIKKKKAESIAVFNKNKKPTEKKDSKDLQQKKKTTYCICKSSDSQRFMIACDNCDEWYHGDCVGVTLSLSKKIKTFYCHLCRHKKRSLAIKYKSKFQDFLKHFNKTSNQNKLANSDESFVKFLKETKIREKKEIELNRKPAEPTKQEPVAKTSNDKPKNNKPKVETSKTPLDTAANHTATTSATPVFNFENSPNRLYGKSNISGEDFENFFSAITKLGLDAAQLATAKTNETPNESNNELTHQDPNLNECSKSRTTNSETEDNDLNNTNFTEDINSNSNEKSFDENDDDSDFEDNSKKQQQQQQQINKPINKTKLNKTTKKSRKQNIKRITTNKMQKQKRRHRTSSASKLLNEESDDQTIQLITNKKNKIREPLQCIGPECVNEAQTDSKYCSTECGMKLAKNRLVHFLKSRIEQYNESPCYSNMLNQTELERINTEIETLRLKLTDLEQKHLDLDRIIERAKFKKINPSIEKERDRNLESNEIEVYCVTCGNLCMEKIALKHMEKCFNKVESQAFFGSYFKTRIDGQSMFCDYYNPQTKMYCKRLKVICPEHEKEKKVNDDEVCGCPLPKPTHVLDDSENEICLASKRTCSLHFKWEKMRRAHIDLEKLRTWLKLEELMEHKRMNETSLNQRAGLLSLLLHQTSSVTNNQTTSEIVLQNQEQFNI